MNIIENNKIQMKKTNEMILNGLKLIYEINGMIFQKRKEMSRVNFIIKCAMKRRKLTP